MLKNPIKFFIFFIKKEQFKQANYQREQGRVKLPLGILSQSVRAPQHQKRFHHHSSN